MKNILFYVRLVALATCLGLSACTSTNSRTTYSSMPSTRPLNMGPMSDTPWQQGAQRSAAPTQAWNTTNYDVPTSDSMPISPVRNGPIVPNDQKTNRPMLPIEL